MHESSPLFDDVSISTQTLRNRLVVAPMTRVSTLGDGVPTENMRRYYQRYADGGFGLIVTEGTYTDRYFSQAYPNQPGMTNDAQQAGWRGVVEAVHRSGSRVVMQLMHGGALSQHLSNTRGASSVQPVRTMLAGYSERQGAFPVPQAMNQNEIDQVIEGFVASALRAEAAGFDGVEIHAANGYLLDQFLTDYTNQREDAYGGSLENRCRLMTDILAAIKHRVSEAFLVGIRVSQGKVNDFDHQWPGGLADAEVIFSRLQRAGASYLHMASEGKGFDHGCLTAQGESLPRLARQLTGLPVIANGGLDDPAQARRMLTEHHGDLIALGTGALANPDWPTRIQQGGQAATFDAAMFEQGVTIEHQFDWENRHPTA